LRTRPPLGHLRATAGARRWSARRKAVIGALSLYLNFINLFTMLLRLVGNRC
jgi:FtsH-binding integral membrane protein